MYHFELLLNSEVQLTESATLGRFDSLAFLDKQRKLWLLDLR